MRDFRLELKKRRRRWIGGTGGQSRFPISSPADEKGNDGMFWDCIHGKNNFATIVIVISSEETNLIVKSAGGNAVESRCLQGTLPATDGLDGSSDIVTSVLSVALQFRPVAAIIAFAVIDVIL